MIFLLQSFTYHNFEGARHKFTTRWSRDVTGVTHTISRRANRFEAMQCCCLSCVCLKHLASMSHKTGVPNRWYIAEVTGVTYKGRDLLTVADRLQSSCVPRLSATTNIASPYPTGVDFGKCHRYKTKIRDIQPTSVGRHCFFFLATKRLRATIISW